MKYGIFTLATVMFLMPTLSLSGEMSQSVKDECMLASKNCTNQVDDIYQRMHRLDREIKKGKKVYTPSELKKLQEKLAETQQMLDTMEKPGK